ncbi:MAG: aminotransferase class I/II-fold pyridoxal phosphate-dependent enzyme [Acidobacteria bacterium]|nr:aminotransferase class I/II-fold pyridoxal phosphate-dependent enzyme [Acidobacteriota bacterium]
MPLLRPDLQQLPAYTRPPGEGGGIPLARLHMNEAAEDWPPAAREALLARLQALDFRVYPERQGDLTERLRRRLGAPEGGVLLGPSSGALLDLVALGGLQPGDGVAVPEPGFSLYPLLVTRHRGRLQRVPVGDTFPMDPWFEALEAGARQLWVTLPNNPTGAWIPPEELEPLLDAAATRPDPPLVLLDEAYAEFAPRTHRLAPERWPNVLLLRTFSKALASAGWRLGYLVGAPGLVGRLAALQLPYSIPAASLEALDVALDHASAFDARVREVAARRVRLSEALTPPAPPSAANFLLVRPDPGPALRAAGQLVRTFAEGDCARVTVGTEAEAVVTARSLGGQLPAPGPRAFRQLLVLDVDGVLIEADRSFMEAVRRALEERIPGIAWRDDHFTAFKRIGGFNNDFRLAAAAWVLAERGQLERVFEGRTFSEIEDLVAAREPEAKATVQRHYADTIHLERPLVNLEELRIFPGDLAVLTGRPPEELELAWNVLGWSLPAIADGGPHLRKPEPAGLLQLADAFRAERVTFVGDTRDDAECVQRARAEQPAVEWRFAAVGPDRARFAAGAAYEAPTLRDLLPTLSREQP